MLRLEADLQDQSGNALIDPMGEPTLPLLALIIVGQALPYLHNGIMVVNSDDDLCVRIESHMYLGLNFSVRARKPVPRSGLCRFFRSFDPLARSLLASFIASSSDVRRSPARARSPSCNWPVSAWWENCPPCALLDSAPRWNELLTAD